MLDRIRMASLQYFIRPVQNFEEFVDQVVGLIETAADYNCHLMMFPEYFSLQLLTLGDTKRPIQTQIRDLARMKDACVEVFAAEAKKHKMHILAGSMPTLGDDDSVYNDAYFFGPSGKFGVQGKIHMTRFEKEHWDVKSRRQFKVFDTEFGKCAITICYDVEFPELGRAAAKNGARLLLVPSCTDDRQGFLRVRYCAQARAVENQMYVAQSSTVGSLPSIPAVSLNYGQASILTPSDFSFSRDGILAEGIPNQETMVIGEMNLQIVADARESGTVLPLHDSQSTDDVKSNLIFEEVY